MKLKLILFFLVFTLPFSSYGRNNEFFVTNKLNEAEDYMKVKPSLSFDILTDHLSDISVLSIGEQLRWHQNLLRVSITLNQFEQAEQTVSAMFAYPELAESHGKLLTAISGSGILLRRMGYPEDGLALLNCGLQQDVNPRQKLSMLLSKGLTLRFLTRNDEAKSHYLQALAIADSYDLTASKSSIYNSLGIIELEQNDYDKAKEHLLTGMRISQQVMRRSGQIISGLNLMLLAVITDDVMLYERLHSRTSNMAASFDNSDRKIFLKWIEAAYNHTQVRAQSDRAKADLVKSLEKIQDINLHNTLVDKLSKKMNVIVQPRVYSPTKYSGPLLAGIKFCETESGVGKGQPD